MMNSKKIILMSKIYDESFSFNYKNKYKYIYMHIIISFKINDYKFIIKNQANTLNFNLFL